MPAPMYEYALDQDDRVTWVDVAWAEFARDNGAPTLPDSVVGTRIWDHFADTATASLYRLLFRHARDRQKSLHVPFRCDAPLQIREMELTILPSAMNLRLSVRLLAQRLRPYVPLLDPEVPRGDAFVRMCAWCGRVHLQAGWHDLESAMQVSGILCEVPLPAVSHGICEDCQQRVIEQIDRDAEELLVSGVG